MEARPDRKATPARPFSTRAFTAVTAGLAAVALLVTGVACLVLEAGPSGDAQHAWTAAHCLVALIFIVAAVWHASLNGRGLLRHLRGMACRAAPISREAVWAVALVAAALGLALGLAHAFLPAEI